jgi:hypothetical protein
LKKVEEEEEDEDEGAAALAANLVRAYKEMSRLSEFMRRREEKQRNHIPAPYYMIKNNS